MSLLTANKLKLTK